MKLSEQDSTIFFRLIHLLQYYVSKKQGIVQDVHSYEEYINCSLTQKKAVVDYLFEHIELIDDFVRENPDNLDPDEIEIVSSWKQFVSGNFIVERILKKYAVLIGDEKVYAVLGLQDSFEEIFEDKTIPMYVKTVLLPFKGKIVYDGFLEFYAISFGGRIKALVKETYRTAKETGTIIHDLLAVSSEADRLPVKKIGDDLRQMIAGLQAIEEHLNDCELSAIEANQVISLLTGAVRYGVQRFGSERDRETGLKEFRKVAQAVSRIEKTFYGGR